MEFKLQCKTVLVELLQKRLSECDAHSRVHHFSGQYPSFWFFLKFVNFNFGTNRLDELFSNYMNTELYQNFFKVVWLLLVLSHC